MTKNEARKMVGKKVYYLPRYTRVEELVVEGFRDGMVKIEGSCLEYEPEDLFATPEQLAAAVKEACARLTASAKKVKFPTGKVNLN